MKRLSMSADCRLHVLCFIKQQFSLHYANVRLTLTNCNVPTQPQTPGCGTARILMALYVTRYCMALGLDTEGRVCMLAHISIYIYTVSHKISSSALRTSSIACWKVCCRLPIHDN